MFRLCIILFISLLTQTAQAIQQTDGQAGTTIAVAISIDGAGFALDHEVDRRLRILIGSAISKGIVDKFLIHGYRQNGGFSGCLQASQSVSADQFQSLLEALQSLPYNKKTTTYAVTPIQACSELVTVYKDDQSLQCAENSGIPLATMQAELESHDISVYSAKQISDGFAHPDECYLDTGILNSYMINASDLDKAVQLGFKLWTAPAQSPNNN